MIEEWKIIKDYENYMISNLGNVKNIKRNRLLKHRLNKGYPFISLWKKNETDKNFSIHRLVAIYFIPNPDNKPDINHKDNNTENFSIENLEWVSKKENIQHAVKQNRIGLKVKGENHGQAILTWDIVKEIRASNLSRKELQLKYNTSKGNIQAILVGRTWK